MPRGSSPKREREFNELKSEFKKEHRYRGREEEVAARIVNKQRAEAGETKTTKRGSKKSSGKSSKKSSGKKSSSSSKSRGGSSSKKKSGGSRKSSSRGRKS
jgi:hypothetical protein